MVSIETDGKGEITVRKDFEGVFFIVNGETCMLSLEEADEVLAELQKPIRYKTIIKKTGE